VKERIAVFWSGGKDIALALHEVLKTHQFEVVALLTVLTKDYNRISIHNVRGVLLKQQVRALGYPLERILIPKGASNEEYERALLEVLWKYKTNGVSSVLFGDIFLEDVRKFRERTLSKVGIEGLFPLWGKSTKETSRKFIKLGFKAITTIVDSTFLGKEFVGRDYDEKFLSDLPTRVDSCGERGEFHSFVYDGSLFQERILFEKGPVILRDGRFFCLDLLPCRQNANSSSE
jgi:uncharacterized protein (TIGR00290 family)